MLGSSWRWKSLATPAAPIGQVSRARYPATSPGFTLIEILVALSILAMVVIAMTRAFDAGLRWTGRNSDRTAATNLALQRLEQIRSWVEGSPDQLVRSLRFASLDAPPWQEPRARLSGDFPRFERETIVDDAAERFPYGQGWLSARVVTVRIYAVSGPGAIAELTTVVAEYP